MEGVEAVNGTGAPSPRAGPRPSADFWRGRRVLVTGHTGFKGSWLTVWLESLGARVLGAALEPETTPSMFAGLKLEGLCDHRVVDVRDAEGLAGLVRGGAPEVVFHMAAQPLVRRGYREPLATYATNVMGTVHLLEACRGVDSLRAVVVVTTDKCYENLEREHAYREGDRLGGRDPYSSSKACAELVTDAYRRSFFADGPSAIATARAGNVIGGGDWSEDRLIPDAALAYAAGEPLTVRMPEATRPWQHVIDPLRGYLLLAEAMAAGRCRAASMNFGPAPESVERVRRVIDLFTREWGGRARWSHVAPERPVHEASLLALDPSLADAELGWRSAIGLDAAVSMTAAWYRRFYAGTGAEEMLRLTREQIEEAPAEGAA